MTDTDKIGEPSRWVPISNPRHLAALGKLLEELGEATSIAARCIIQGIDEKDPKTGEVNRAALAKEIADVGALSDLVADELNINLEEMWDRAKKKYDMKKKWLEML
jgi:NTP pyrophosphatase (non-canonical NTP hydrolase)